ncbi:MAG TPA: hypothetical protein PLV65_10175, partial [Tenuifilaceae bacterium]|nr:hypothetical protein [Tenuifilaceae bacterium]
MKLIAKVIFAVALISICFDGISQTARLKRANAFYEAGGYFEAVELYRRDLDKVEKEEMGLYLQRIAECYRLMGDARQAEY